MNILKAYTLSIFFIILGVLIYMIALIIQQPILIFIGLGIAVLTAIVILIIVLIITYKDILNT